MATPTPVVQPKRARTSVACAAAKSSKPETDPELVAIDAGLAREREKAAAASREWTKKVAALNALISCERKQKRRLAEENEAMTKKLKFLQVDMAQSLLDDSHDHVNLVTKEGSCIRCSNFVLARASAVLKMKLVLGEDISNIFSDVEPAVLDTFLHFLETADVPLEELEQFDVDLLTLAVEYEVDQLRDVCLDHMLHSYPRLMNFVVDYDAARDKALAIHSLWDAHKDIPKLQAISRAVTESFMAFRFLRTISGENETVEGKEALEQKLNTMKTTVHEILEENETAKGVRCGTVKEFVWDLGEEHTEQDRSAVSVGKSTKHLTN